MVIGLTRVSWERVDVSFHSSRQRFAAHSVIQVPLSLSLSAHLSQWFICKGVPLQVKYSFMHSEGADVIQHMIDRFLT